jgi:LysM repeat protein
MNNPSPLVPQGIIDKKATAGARVKIAVFFVLAVHGVGLLALLLQGCHREDANTQANNQTTNAVAPTDVTTPPAMVEQPAAQPPAPTNTIAAQAIAEPVAPPPTPASDYVVTKGDTYSTIAKKFPGVSIKGISEANPGVEPTKLHVGQKLHIPAPSKTMAAASGGTAANDSGNGEHVYTVKSGDNLLKIAAEHHTTVRAIRAANSLRSDRITVGQKLKIPAKGQTPSPETASFTAPQPDSHLATR